MENEGSTRSRTQSHTETNTQSATTLPACSATINEQVLICAFYKHCRGMIRFGDVPGMVKRPSGYDKALLYLLNSFFVSSVFAAAQCALFGIDGQGLSYLSAYVKNALTKKEKNLLNQWKERS